LERIIAITDERIRQILTAAAAAAATAGLQKKLALAPPRARLACASAGRTGGHPRFAIRSATLS
jgi:hypothetical protein